MSAPSFKSKNNVHQKINLKEEFGVDLRGMDSLKEAIGGAIIERIRARTEAGNGMSFSDSGRGTPVKLKSPYSKEYADSLDFKAFGKSRGKVNMTLTGDMLGLMDVVKIEGNTIKIGWADTSESAKAHGHSTGAKGRLPVRPFFGVSKSELKEIKKEFGDAIKEAVRTRNSEGREAFESRVAELLALVTGNDSSVDAEEG